MHNRRPWRSPRRTTQAHPPRKTTTATEHMLHLLTKRHLSHDDLATNNTRGRRTLPLQLASPEGTFTWGETQPGSTALTYLWL